MSPDLTKTAIGLGILYAIYHFAPNSMVKAMVLGVGGTLIAKQIPYVQDLI